jgi:hypothetical protein
MKIYQKTHSRMKEKEERTGWEKKQPWTQD